jgi:hypothetical protein
MDSENLFKGLGKLWKGKAIIKKVIEQSALNADDVIDKSEFEHKEIYVREDEKVNVEIREIVRIRPQDFQALKSSFEEWARTWD